MAVLNGMQELPQPGPFMLEIQFRRLLNQCMARTLGPSTSQPGLGDWRSDPKYHSCVELLQEKLYDLQTSSSDDRPSPEILALYQQHVKALIGELRPPDLPAFCKKVSAQDKRAPAASLQAAALQGVSSTDAAYRRLGGVQTAMAAPQPPASSSTGTISLSSTAKDRLRTQQRLQDDLTSEMVDMTQDLKSSALAMQNAIRYRGEVLDQAEVALDDSTLNAQQVAARAKAQHAFGRRNFCTTCFILLAVFIIFAGMLVFIRVTSIVGLGKRS